MRRTRGFSVVGLAAEALKSLSANAVRSGIVGIVIAASVAGSSALELLESGRALALEEQLADAGRYVVIASSDEGVSNHLCATLRQNEHVVATGTVNVTGPVTITHLPGIEYQSAQVIAGSFEVWLGDSLSLGDHMWIGDQVVSDLGGTVPRFLAVNDVVSTVTGSIPSVRNPSLERWIVETVAPVGVSQECWIEWRPGAFNGGLGATSYVLEDPELIVRERLARSEFSRNPQADYESRISLRAWLAAAAFATLALWLSYRSRQPEFAMYRSIGVSRSELYVMAQLEVALLVLAVGPLGLVVANLAHLLWSPEVVSGSQIVNAVAVGIKVMSFVIVASPLGQILATRGRIADLLKTR